jgi:hypothetical protein
MIDNNPTFSKENIKKVASILGQASWTLIYDSNKTQQQIHAGKELLPAKYIVAHIGDHIFDYYPYRYFLNDEQVEDFNSSIPSLLTFFSDSIVKALDAIDASFPVLETITRDKLNQHRVPHRKPEEEELVKNFFNEVLNNIDEVEERLNGPKKVLNPDKPSDIQIKHLISALSTIQDNMSKYGEESGADGWQTYQFNQMVEMFKLPLYCAWQLYKYGWHTDFLQEGDSLMPYMSFEIDAIKKTTELIEVLKSSSPFSYFERDSMITDGLIYVYSQLVKGLRSGELKIS